MATLRVLVLVALTLLTTVQCRPWLTVGVGKTFGLGGFYGGYAPGFGYGGYAPGFGYGFGGYPYVGGLGIGVGVGPFGIGGFAGIG